MHHMHHQHPAYFMHTYAAILYVGLSRTGPLSNIKVKREMLTDDNTCRTSSTMQYKQRYNLLGEIGGKLLPLKHSSFPQKKFSPIAIKIDSALKALTT